MSVPTLTVEFAPTSTPLDTTPTWVDITQYVRFAPGIQIRRGRSSELDEFSAGTMTLTLNNRSRRFDPRYSSGPYYGNLKPGKLIRVRATWSAVTYDVFTGWVTGWPQGFSNLGRDATVTVHAYDAIGWMSRNRLPSDYVYTYADAAADPGDLTLFLRRTDAYLWLDETGNSDGATLVYGKRDSGGSLMAGSASPSINFDGATVWSLSTPVSSGTGGWTVAFVMQTSVSVTNYGYICGDMTGSFTGSVGAAVGTYDGKITWLGYASAGDPVTSVTTVARVSDGRPHLVTITGNGAGDADDVTIYIDGEIAAVDRVDGNFYGKMAIAYVGDEAGAPLYTASVTNYSGSVQDLAFWATTLPQAAVETLWAYVSGYLEEDTSSRAERYLDESGWPATWRDIATSKSTSGELIFGGRTVIEAIQELERTEQGRVFASKANYVTLLQRYHTAEVTRGSTVQVTFSDDGAGVGYATYGADQAYLDIQNDITVKAAQRGDGRAVDLTSIDDHGAQTVEIDTILTDPRYALAMAQGLVYQRKDPLTRLEPMTVRSIPDSLWDNVLGLELGDRIAAEITPMRLGSQVVEEMTLEGLSWNINTKVWELTVTGAPAPPDFFIVGSSLVGGTDVIGY